MITCNQNLQYLLINILVLYAFYFGLCIGICNITSTQYLRDPATLWCPGNIFKLGFFNPQNSSYRYVGIWYNFSETTVVWVANRDKPLKDSSGVVKISEDGNLVVMNGDKQTLWSSNISSTSNTTNSTAQLQGGNLVLLDNSNGSIIWQSYQHPSDTFLPKMKIPINSEKTREKTGLRSWKSPLDPNFGDFSSSITTILPQLFIWKGKYPLWRSGQWNGQIFIGVKNMRSVHTGGYNVVDDEEGTVYLTGLADRKEAVRFTLEPNGNLVQSNWDENERNWKIPWLAISDDCDVYGTCGPFGCCNSLDSPICSCLRGFDPKSREEWEKGNWSSGCARRKPLQCEEKNKTSKEDGFVKMEFMKVPDFAEWLPPKMEDECRSQCLKNFSCLAYAFDAGIGCMSWSRSLIDIQELQRAGTTLYIRVAYSELDHPRVIRLVAVLVIVSFLIVCVGVFLCLFWISRRRSKIWFQFKRNHQLHGKKISLEENITTKVDLDDLSMFKFEVLAMSTDQFHENNKLGQGGFGPVYKGILADGKEIAVKRLSTASGQGMKEFMNEVLLISTVQHRNLVKLLGCCIEKEEKMLIYEYLPNKSLDVFLFDNDFNPKISDFGMARIFKCNQDQAETRKVAGTYGYMAPEYAIKGRFSEKSDVFSFGVLLLEIMCGQKVASFWNEDIPLSLLGYAWELWKENNTSKFIDPVIWDPDFEVVLKRCIHIGLLCVQEFARDRPTISTVLSMLSSEVTSLPAPLQPAFANFFEDNGGSVNYVTLTNLDGR
ncbi:G-type lectin S-receptor-like serine/threonine-protein kinase At1g11330 isoform X2 [Nicotiana tabacum]|uniref:G-type lectin S-receptor-like serine/threonine-protein kinase At1g11330 isoform X2 n=1 Tax=Nicotiana tabacum TaxID=4097 RepID=A0AC58T7D8_TOBAC